MFISEERDAERRPEHSECGTDRWLFPEIKNEELEREHNKAIMERFRRRIQSDGVEAPEAEVVPEEEPEKATGAITNRPSSTPAVNGNGWRQRRLRRRGHRR